MALTSEYGLIKIDEMIPPSLYNWKQQKDQGCLEDRFAGVYLKFVFINKSRRILVARISLGQSNLGHVSCVVTIFAGCAHRPKQSRDTKQRMDFTTIFSSRPDKNKYKSVFFTHLYRRMKVWKHESSWETAGKPVSQPCCILPHPDRTADRWRPIRRQRRSKRRTRQARLPRFVTLNRGSIA